jgi:transposase
VDWVGELLGLPEFNVIDVNTKYATKVIIEVETKNISAKCPNCHKLTSKIDHRYLHIVRDNSISGKKAYLSIRKKVFYCRPCDYSFAETIDSIPSKHIYTKRYERTVFEGCLENTISNVGRTEKLPYDCVRGIYKRIADVCIEHLMNQSEEIEILGIDEIAIRKGHKDFQAVVSNISGGYVMEMLPDRKKSTVLKYLRKLPKKAKKRIVFVSIDMWEGYFRATKEALPGTTIVIDRFHVMKNLNAAITSYRRTIQREVPKDIRDKYKGYRWVLVKNEENMSDEDLAKLKKMMEECPELKQLYELKVRFQQIFDHTQKAEVADEKLKAWEKEVAKLNNSDMGKFLKLLTNWREWILNYFVSKKVTNAFVEGMNNKIKLIKRAGYGYRNKINFRRKVLIECGYNNLRKSKKLEFLR